MALQLSTQFIVSADRKEDQLKAEALQRELAIRSLMMLNTRHDLQDFAKLVSDIDQSQSTYDAISRRTQGRGVAKRK